MTVRSGDKYLNVVFSFASYESKEHFSRLGILKSIQIPYPVTAILTTIERIKR
ncbi:hypothetical protein RKLH11_4314 [Rhodobacteraceae bacterium KLH11]|nr:hypothetical protein RKLH11_4314 [Rhodobacteraceae bacterium KLH11]